MTKVFSTFKKQKTKRLETIFSQGYFPLYVNSVPQLNLSIFNILKEDFLKHTLHSCCPIINLTENHSGQTGIEPLAFTNIYRVPSAAM